jgi:hypothetical protein
MGLPGGWYPNGTLGRSVLTWISSCVRVAIKRAFVTLFARLVLGGGRESIEINTSPLNQIVRDGRPLAYPVLNFLDPSLPEGRHKTIGLMACSGVKREELNDGSWISHCRIL